MGVLNVTPDSFSDGGRYDAPAEAIARGHELAAQGADWVDVGGESTRPGAEPPPTRPRSCGGWCPWSRPWPARASRVSIDTRKAGVARAAVAGRRPDDQRRVGLARRGGRRPRRGLGGHARAGRPADDAGRPPLRRRGRRGAGPPRGPGRAGPRGRRARGVDRPRHRLREDHRAQPPAPRAPRRAGGHGPPRAGGHEPQALPRGAARPVGRQPTRSSAPTTGSRARWPPPPGRWPAAPRWCGCTTYGRRAMRSPSSPERSGGRRSADEGQVGAGDPTPQLLVDPQGPAGRVRAARRATAPTTAACAGRRRSSGSASRASPAS